MNAQELLNVLDIIKNEDVYKQRLAEIKAAEKSLAESRAIAASVEKAFEFEDQAQAKLQDLVNKKAELETKLENERKAQTKTTELLQAEATKKLEEARQLKMDATEKLQNAKTIEKQAQEEFKKSIQWNKELAEKQSAVKELESMYLSKLSKLRIFIVNELGL